MDASPRLDPHHRDDGELWVPVDVLGRTLSQAGEWLDAEEVLEAHGIA